MANGWLHTYLRRIKQEYPELAIELTVDLSINLDRFFASHSIDLAIQTASFSSPASGIISLGDFPYVWVAPPHTQEQLAGKVSVGDLIPHTILTHARHTQAYRELSDYAASQALSTSRIASSSSLSSCAQMAADGMGVALLPRALIEKQLCNNQLRVLDVTWHPAALQFCARYPAEKAPRYIVHAARLAVDVVQDEG